MLYVKAKKSFKNLKKGFIYEAETVEENGIKIGNTKYPINLFEEVEPQLISCDRKPEVGKTFQFKLNGGTYVSKPKKITKSNNSLQILTTLSLFELTV